MYINTNIQLMSLDISEKEAREYYNYYKGNPDDAAIAILKKK